MKRKLFPLNLLISIIIVFLYLSLKILNNYVYLKLVIVNPFSTVFWILALSAPIFSAVMYGFKGLKNKKISIFKTIILICFSLLQGVLISTLPLVYIQMGEKLIIIVISLSFAFSIFILLSEYLWPRKKQINSESENTKISEDHYSLIILFLSIISIIIITLLDLEVFLKKMPSENYSIGNEEVYGNTLNAQKNVILISTLIIFIFLTSSISGYKYAISKSKRSKIFALLGFMPFLSIFIFLNLIPKFQNLNLIKTRKWLENKKVILNTNILLSIFSLGAAIGVIAWRPDSYITSIPIIEYSIDKNNPNTILIFADGMAGRYSKRIVEEIDDLSDYIIADRFLTSGQYTIKSLTTELGGSSFLPWNKKDEINRYQSFDAYSYLTGFVDSKIYGFNLYKNRYNQFFNLGTYADARSTNYRISINGDISLLNKLDPKIKSLSLVGAKEYQTNNGWGITKNHPDTNLFRVAESRYRVKNSGKGAFVFISGEQVHGPYSMTRNEKFSFINTGIENSTYGTLESLASLKRTLPKEVYDNSNIILFSDHSTHLDKLFTSRINDTSWKPNGTLFMKPAHYHSNRNVHINNLIWGPYLNNIISEMIIHPSHLLDWLKNDNHFKYDKLPILLQDNTLGLIGWDSIKDKPILVDHSSDEKQYHSYDWMPIAI